jgi:HEPN domain-containing protein
MAQASGMIESQDWEGCKTMGADRSRYWIDIAEYDMETAKAMLTTGRRLYVGFLCHQVVEKMLKAAIAKDGTIPPKVHNLTRLAELGQLSASMTQEQNDFIDALLPLNIEARYPIDKDKLLGVLTEGYCRELISKTEGLMLWIKSKL